MNKRVNRIAALSICASVIAAIGYAAMQRLGAHKVRYTTTAVSSVACGLDSELSTSEEQEKTADDLSPKTIWIMNHYATGMFFNEAGRHYWFAKELKSRGYEPVIFCCNTRHNAEGAYFEDDGLYGVHEASIGVPFVVISSTEYMGNGTDRMRNMAVFARNLVKVGRKYAEENGKPDVILASSVHPLTVLAGEKLAHELCVPCICEVRDLWPESLVEYGYLGKGNPITKLLYRIEKGMYERADAIVFTMEGGAQYITDKGWDTAHGGNIDLAKVHHINNGIDLVAYDRNKVDFPFNHPALEPNGRAKLIYAGSIRKANDVGFLVDVAACMSEDPVDFVVIGDGDERASLVEKVEERGLSNIYFIGRIDKRNIPSALSQGMMMLLLYSSSQASVSKYGMSQNKLFDYLASGKPILSNLPSGYSIINRYECGVERAFEGSEDCAHQIREMLANESRIVEWSENSRKTAYRYSFEVHSKTLVKIIESLILKQSEHERGIDEESDIRGNR